MSKITIVGGEIIETVGGNYNIYADSLKYSAGTTFTENAKDVVNYTNSPESPPEIKMQDSPETDFDIKLSINKQDNTFVPLGIADFKNKEENQFFRFKYTLEKSELDEFYFEIIGADGNQLFKNGSLKTVVVKKEEKEKLFEPEKPKEGPLVSKIKPIGSPVLEPFDYTAMGNYIISWDGFGDDGIYDSSKFNGKTLKAKIIGIKDCKQKSVEVEFTTEYHCVPWVDTKIDRNKKRIDVTLRVNLQDGGAKGLDSWNNTRNNGTPDSVEKFNDWDKIPADVIAKAGKPVIKTRTKSFDQLKQLSIDGLKNHWGRNSENLIGNSITIIGEKYEVFLEPTVTTENSMKAVSLKFNTNTNWGRSNNPGCINGFKSFLANAAKYIPYVPLDASIYYNVGYINRNYKFESDILLKNDWRYIDGTSVYVGRTNANLEDKEFSFTAAHELGHSILKEFASYGGGSADYSYEHKGSSGYSNTKSVSEGGFKYPAKPDEIDLMKYYNEDPLRYDYDRVVAAEIDVLGLLWLTKINIK